METFLTNSIGPTLMAKHFHPLLEQKSPYFSKYINISARIGSIGDNKLGGWYGYRMSKCALNMLTKTMSVELRRKNIICISFQPGTMDTDFTKPYRSTIKTLLPV